MTSSAECNTVDIYYNTLCVPAAHHYNILENQQVTREKEQLTREKEQVTREKEQVCD